MDYVHKNDDIEKLLEENRKILLIITTALGQLQVLLLEMKV